MHHFLLVLGWVLGLSAAIVASLIIIALSMATVRAMLGNKNPAWSVADVATAEALTAAEPYWHRALVALDIFLNVVVLKGWQDETISTHAWRASLLGHRWGIAVAKWLSWIQPNHGQKAASGDLERATSRVSVLSRLLKVPFPKF